MTPLQQAEARLWMLVREETPFVRVGDIESVLSELARLCADVARLRVVDDGMVERALKRYYRGCSHDDGPFTNVERHDMCAALEAAMGRG